ncbi:hypothetical protein [Silvibacterium acidisoli]|uniref:hypothetical protein n=1 Tax=Acidobacteriaceae bacterium ZG23-2 TaxID=2883246 RepID=UPI00406C21CF
MKRSFLFGVLLSTPGLVLAGSVRPAFGQAAVETFLSSVSEQPNLPDAPSPSPQQSSLPNDPSSNPMRSMHLREKFQSIVEPAFGPRAFVFNGAFAGIRMANAPDSYPHEWRAGAEAFGRNYGDAFARTGSLAIARFSTSVLLHEDTRYQRSRSSSVPGRLSHALLFTFIDKTDGGHTMPALSNFTGAAAAGFIGNAYLPTGFDDLTHAGQGATVAFGGLAVGNITQEFAPEIGRALLKIHIRHVPLPPVWWTGGN